MDVLVTGAGGRSDTLSDALSSHIISAISDPFWGPGCPLSIGRTRSPHRYSGAYGHTHPHTHSPPTVSYPEPYADIIPNADAWGGVASIRTASTITNNVTNSAADGKTDGDTANSTTYGKTDGDTTNSATYGKTDGDTTNNANALGQA